MKRINSFPTFGIYLDSVRTLLLVKPAEEVDFLNGQQDSSKPKQKSRLPRACNRHKFSAYILQKRCAMKQSEQHYIARRLEANGSILSLLRIHNKSWHWWPQLARSRFPNANTTNIAPAARVQIFAPNQSERFTERALELSGIVCIL